MRSSPTASACAPGNPAPGPHALRLLLLLVALPWGRAVLCVSSGVPKPTNITFFSINMKNVLQWNPPEGLHEIGLTYTVQYFIYGQNKWLSKSECKRINRTYCDLSAETSDYEHQYYAKVKAIWETNCSDWAESERFYPFLETQIGPPEIALAASEKSISIVLTAPEKWKRKPEDPTVSMQLIYSNLKYNVSVYNTNSKRTWSQFVTNHTLVFSWMEPNTLYCVTVQSFVPGPPRPAQPSQQCISTLKDQTSALNVKIIFWYVLPISVVLLLCSVIGYSIYRYIHVGKEKHPANLILIYGSKFDKRFFMPAEKIVVSFVTLSILDDPKIAQKDTVENLPDGATLPVPAPPTSPEPHGEETWVKRVGYASHLMEIVWDGQEAALRQEAWLVVTTECEYDVPALISMEPAEDQLSVQEEGPRQGTLPVPPAALAQALLYSYAPRLCDLEQEHTASEEPSMTLVDWDPGTRRLCIPSLAIFDPEHENCDHCEGYSLPEQSLVSRMYEKQAWDMPAEESDDYFTEFMEE